MTGKTDTKKIGDTKGFPAAPLPRKRDPGTLNNIL